MISKVHKTLVAGRPSCDTHSLITPLVSTLVLKLLTVIHEKLSKQFCNTVLEPFYIVCLSTDEALARTKRAHNLNTSKISYFHSRDFMSMYSNLVLQWYINAILQLAIEFGRLSLDDEISILFSRRY
jgi:hypothetical protein